VAESKNILDDSDLDSDIDGLDRFSAAFDNREDFVDRVRPVNPYKPSIAADGSGAIHVQSRTTVKNEEDSSRLQIDDTFFAEKFAEMRRKGVFDWDNELLNKLNVTMYESLCQQASVQMLVNDIGNSITTYGMESEFDGKSLMRDLLSMLRLKNLKTLVSVLSLDEYKDDIMVRLIDSTYGSTRRIERAKAERELRQDERVEYGLKLMLNIGKQLDEVSKDLKRFGDNNKIQKPSIFTASRAFKRRGDTAVSDYDRTTNGGDSDEVSR